MTPTTERSRRWRDHPWCLVAVALTLLVQLGTAGLIAWEQTWGEPRRELGGQATFVAGSVGTEFIPLPVLEILPEIDPDAFPSPAADPTTGALSGGWIDAYGFVARRGVEPTFPETGPELAALLKADPELAALPVGFTLTKVRPFSPDPSPVRFVGLGCAGCHSARLPDAGPNGAIVYGAGNPSLDLKRFFEAFRGVLLKKVARPGVDKPPVSVTEGPDLDPGDLDHALTIATIKAAREAKGLPGLGPADDLMIRVWLASSRGLAEENTRKYDLPATPAQLRLPEFNDNGPGRTEPFVTLDNVVLGLPAKANHGFSKIPAVFREGDRAWAQFDGSVRDSHTRSGLAAMTAGGSVDNLGGLGVGHHIIAAAEYTRTALVGPRWADLLGRPPGGPPPAGPAADPEEARLDESQRRGRVVYRRHCATCHGRPNPDDPTTWRGDLAVDRLFGKIVPTVDPFDPANTPPISDWISFPDRETWDAQRTDPSRVVFRDGRIIPYKLFTYFDRGHPIKPTGEYYPLDHPLAIVRKLIRNSGGYVNAPLDSLFLRAPYLHNGSVPTLAQLINLDERPRRFLRGRNTYDADKVGLVAPAPPAGSTPRPGDRPVWPFDTTAPGNANRGHNYPWAFDDKARDPKALADLLAYLKTF